MAIINLIKVIAFWIIDTVNRLFEPWQEFNRPLDVKYYETLEEKAPKFEYDMKSQFGLFSNRIWTYKLPLDAGDQCLWHGVYTAMWAMKAAHTNEPSDMETLRLSGDGMLYHQNDLFEPQPRLIRGVYNLNGEICDDVSNDQASGHLLGIYYLYRYGNNECREIATELIEGLTDEILGHNYCLVDLHGKPTKYGRLINGFKTDPLNLTLCLAILALAYRITNRLEYKTHFDKLMRKYKAIVPYAHFKLLWWGQTSTALRAAIHYSILCNLTPDLAFSKGFSRLWRMERNTANPTVYALLRDVMWVDQGDLENVVKRLKEMTLEDKQRPVEKINSDTIPTVNWGGHKRARQPIPRWKMGSQDYFDSRHAYSVDDWKGSHNPEIRHNGADFLFPYYALKLRRLI